MRYAVTDIGSNTVKMTVYDVENGILHPLISRSAPVGLAGYRQENCLTAEGIEALAEVLCDYRSLAKAVGTEHFFGIATASLRNLNNAGTVVEKIRRRCGVEIDIIDGDREAELGFIGFCDAVWDRFRRLPEDGVFLDMGGGSTEFVLVRDGCAVHRTSLSFGALKLYNSYVSGIIPDEEEKARISAYVEETLAKNLSEGGYCGKTVYITGGTSKAIGKVLAKLVGKPHGSMVEFLPEDFTCLSVQIAGEGKAFLHRLAAAVPDRIHMLLPGLLAFLEIFRYFGTERVFTVYSGIRDGFMLDRIRKGLL